MAIYVRSEITIFKDGVQIQNFEEDLTQQWGGLKLYDEAEIINYANGCFTTSCLYNDTGIFVISMILYTAGGATLSADVELEQAYIVETIKTSLSGVKYSASQ